MTDQRRSSGDDQKLLDMLCVRYEEALREGGMHRQKVEGFDLVHTYRVGLQIQLETPGNAMNSIRTAAGLGLLDVPESSQRYKLSAAQREGIEAAALVEDHLPGYASEYLRLFRTEGLEPDDPVYFYRSAMQKQIHTWNDQEEGHASLLEAYMLLAGPADLSAFMRNKAKAGTAQYAAPYDDPRRLFLYTFLQEAATMLFYNALRTSVDEPVLKSAVAFLGGQESKHRQHFWWRIEPLLFSEERDTQRAFAEVLESPFGMPLLGTVERYKRIALWMIRATNSRYDYRQCFDHFIRVVQKVGTARSTSRDHPVWRLQELAQMQAP